jgi:pSer/pThr/pTyr-binding forkhead associated (FHA) protein
MKLSLLVMTPGKQQGKALDIKTPQFLIGRDPQCQLRPASPLISKRHCAIIVRDGQVYIRDFGSTNGTFVNEEPVQGERELLNDDLLKVGPIEFTVRLETAALSPGKPTPAPATRPAGTTPAPAVKKDETPAPASAPTAKAEKSDEDDIAAMLLELDDGSVPVENKGADGVPEGSTVFDLKVPPEVQAAGQPEKKEAPKPAADTRSAAASILEKMMRRPRTGE